MHCCTKDNSLTNNSKKTKLISLPFWVIIMTNRKTA